MIPSTSTPTIQPSSQRTEAPSSDLSNVPSTTSTSKQTLSPSTDPHYSPTTRPSFPIGFTLTMSESPSTVSFIQTDALFYTCGDVITVSFQNARPDRNDWIGLYPSSSFVNNELPSGAIDWTYACGSQNCLISTNSNVTTFEVNLRTTETQGLEGSLQIFLIGDTGAPYTDIIATSDVFQVIGCSHVPSTMPSLSPSDNTIISPPTSSLPTSVMISMPSLDPTNQPFKNVSLDVLLWNAFIY